MMGEVICISTELADINSAVKDLELHTKDKQLERLTYIRKYFEKLRARTFDTRQIAGGLRGYIKMSEAFNGTCVRISQAHAKAIALPGPGCGRE